MNFPLYFWGCLSLLNTIGTRLTGLGTDKLNTPAHISITPLCKLDEKLTPCDGFVSKERALSDVASNSIHEISSPLHGSTLQL